MMTKVVVAKLDAADMPAQPAPVNPGSGGSHAH
jgi:hypothetical protein